MKCSIHPEFDAISTCQGCGKGLCDGCSRRFTIQRCESCLLAHNRSVATNAYTQIFITALILIGATYILGSLKGSHGESIGYSRAWTFGLYFAFIYWGWKYLGNHPRWTIVGTGTFFFLYWIFHFIFKLIISGFISMIVGPYQIFKMVKELNVVNKTKKQIELGEI